LIVIATSPSSSAVIATLATFPASSFASNESDLPSLFTLLARRAERHCVPVSVN
jgi:hypothetical protein